MYVRARPLLALAVILTATPSHALTLLTTDKGALFQNRGGGKQSAVIAIGKDRALASLIDPTCPTTSSLQIASYPSQVNQLVAQPVVDLPCANWRAVRGGFRYSDKSGAAGGVRRIVYTKSRLVIRVQGGTYAPVPGPLGYVEAWLGIGSERFLARFHNFVKNTARTVGTRLPTSAAGTGEQAFWDVLWGDDPSDARQAVALDCLASAISQDPKDGHSRFLLAMMRLYRFDAAATDYRTASATAKAEIQQAAVGLQTSVPLLWNGHAGDSRVPGFAAAAEYAVGVTNGDDAVAAEGITDLNAAITINPIFNLFDYIGVVPSTVLPTDPLYARAIELLDLGLSPENAACVSTQPEICGNQGMAPHNIEGAFLLFGDVYAKGGVLSGPEHPFGGAQGIYGLLETFATSYGWNPAFQAIAAERVATVADRVALYQNADPADDPPLMGYGPGETNCQFCHLKH